MKTIFEMAREAGAYPAASTPRALLLMSESQIERFAELVRADEREACLKVADEWSKRRDDVGGYISRNIRARGNT